MPWSGGTFTRTNGTETGVNTWADNETAGDPILEGDHDIHDQDLAAGIGDVLKKDGGVGATADIGLATNRFTNVGAATTNTQYITLGQGISNSGIYCPTVNGTANAITVQTGLMLSSISVGQIFTFIAGSTITEPLVTLGIDGLTAAELRVSGQQLACDQIEAGQAVTVTYDGTYFQMSVGDPKAVCVGSIMGYSASGSLPAGLLECNGQAVSRTTYDGLFDVIGTTYGIGDGSTTFNLPDITGRAIFGEEASATRLTPGGGGIDGSVLGDTGGGETVILTTTTMASHTHTGTTDGHNHDYTRYGTRDDFGSGSAFSNIWRNNSTRQTTTDTDTFTTSSVGSGDAWSNLPDGIVQRWVIVAQEGACITVKSDQTVETWIGAGDMIARSANGADAGTYAQGSGSFITATTWDFATGADEFVSFEWAPPKRWDNGTVTFTPYWTNASGTAAQTVTWSIAAAAISDGDALGATLGTAVTSADTYIAQGDLHIAPETSDCTIGGTPATADLIAFSLQRDVSEDDLTDDAQLLGVVLKWTAKSDIDV